ncbi:MAG: indolepyruvate oxidoreductase subunit beta [Spirochaetaceae bacterium]|nr:MAG: indolepyruvate oxidoreductase subunit beta [Spirochaetaceae bacterium]
MADKPTSILMVGVGGQGIIMASDIACAAALHAGFDAKKSEIHGMSQRGGSVFSHVRFGKEIFSPVIPEGKADILLSLELMETLRWTAFAGPQTKFIVSWERILPANTEEYPAGVEDGIRSLQPSAVFVDPKELVEKIGDKKYINVAFCGILSRYVDLPEEAWKKAVDEHVPAGTFEANWAAFLTGKP